MVDRAALSIYRMREGRGNGVGKEMDGRSLTGDHVGFLAKSPINRLLDLFGMNDRVINWLTKLIINGEIPIEERPLMKQHLAEAKGKEREKLLGNLVLPFERRFGYVSILSRRGTRSNADAQVQQLDTDAA